jgi:hypothetical protein
VVRAKRSELCALPFLKLGERCFVSHGTQCLPEPARLTATTEKGGIMGGGRGGGRGGGGGRGQGRGPGRMGGSKTACPGGYCICSKCGHRLPHQVGQP